MYYYDLKSDGKSHDASKKCIYNSNKIDFGSLNNLNKISEGSNAELSNTTTCNASKEEATVENDLNNLTFHHRKVYDQEKNLENLKLTKQTSLPHFFLRMMR